MVFQLYAPFLWMGFNCLKATATSRRQFTFYHSVPRNSWYSLCRPRKDERLSRPCSHPVVLNTRPYSYKKMYETSVWQYNFTSLRIYQQKAETHYVKLNKIKDSQYVSFSIDIKTTKTAPLLLRYSKLLKYFLTH